MESPLRADLPAGTRLIETFGWRPGLGAPDLDRHLARMARSARALGLAFDPEAAHRAIVARGAAPLRCRLTLGADGLDFAAAPLAETQGPWRIAVAPERLNAADPWLRHKSTQRALYDTTRAAMPQGVDEVIFLNGAGHVCEGTITNVFADPGDGTLVTPPLVDGLLPGILREKLLEEGRAREGHLRPGDLHGARTVWVGNALRGLIPAVLVTP